MSRIYVSIPFTDKQAESLRQAAAACGDEITFLQGAKPTDEQLKDADAWIGNIPAGRVKTAEKLQWLQLNSAGADAYAKEGILPEGVVLTCATGAYGTAISEYMTAMLLVMMKRIPQYLQDQQAGRWVDEGPVLSPAGKRILIVGTGDIGLSFARKIRGFELPDHPITLTGVRRRADSCPRELDEIHSLDELEEEVSKADVIAVALPGTPATKHLFNEELLRRCKKGAYFMNVGRGNVVDNEALKKPEVYGNFAGMWLDVFEQEPLPDGDALYSVPGLIVTPHITGQFHLDVTLQRIAEISLHNYKAWKSGGSFRSRVDLSTGYAG